MICLFGGTFDPIHLGHLHAAVAVCEELGVEEIRLVLSARPGHKQNTGASASDRWQMLCLACSDDSRLVADQSEVLRAKPSYTVDTLLELRTANPTNALSWVIGSDAYALLPSWYRWREVLELSNLVVLRRPGYSLELDSTMVELTRSRQVERLSGAASGEVLVLESPMEAVAAEDIRASIAAGRSADHLLPIAVATYIKDHNLYGDG